MSGPMPRYLLDKNVVRRLVKALWRLDQASVEEQLAIALWQRLRQTGQALYMSVETGNLLRRFPAYREITLVRNTIEVLEAGRYFKRWAHRLRRHGFTREDAKLLSLGVFGTDVAGGTLGVDIIVTFDRPLVNHYRQLTPALASQLAAMTTDLGMPYTAARPPKVVLPAELWLEQMVKDDRS